MPKRTLAFVTMAAALSGAVLATPGSGILSGTVVARAGFVDSVDVKFKVANGRQEVFHVPEAQETVMQQVAERRTSV